MINRKQLTILLGTTFLLLGCNPQQPKIQEPVKVKEVKKVKKYSVPKAPKKNIKLKEVEDTNFSSEYMYPETKKKKEKPATVAHAETSSMAAPAVSTGSMGKGECIAMIGQEKFDKYTQMLGDEASAIKRCQMLKAM